MRRIFTLLLLTLSVLASAQLSQPFSEMKGTDTKIADHRVKKFIVLSFARQELEKVLASIPAPNTLEITKSPVLIDLPDATGAVQRFYISECQTLSPETALSFPEIKTYDLRSLDGSIRGRLTLSPLGVQAMLVSPAGRYYITPVDFSGSDLHRVYFSRDYETPASIICGVDDLEDQIKGPQMKTTALLGDCMLRTYNFAVAATGEFTTLLGNQTNAIASITSTVANINLIYERDLGIHLNLITNTSITYTNAGTDPYPTASFPTQTILDNNTNALNTNIGSSNFDIGMVFNNGWNGGLAYTPGLCNAVTKGGGAAGITGAPFGPVMENVVAHEIGHLFSAKHTMSAGTGTLCIDNLNLPTAYEIGGGSTIMAYAGSVCAGMAYQNNTDDYFHFNSVKVIRTYAQSLSTCGTTTNAGNTAPVLSVAASGYTIPVSTPFELDATGLDNNNNYLTYTFEQYDVAGSAMTTAPAASSATGPMFRSYPPSTANSRTFPALSYILSNTSYSWEVLPSVSRTLNFKVLVRDNNSGDGCVAQDSIAVTTNSSAGPFAITSQNAPVSYTANGTNTMPLTWNVASTTSAPVSCSSVNIYFSANNGQTFPYTLATNLPNNGTASVIVPNVNTTTGRIKIKAANNIFFDINNAPITVSSSCTANGSTFSPSVNVTAQQGNPALNLSLSPNYGSVVSISGTLSNTDPQSSLTVVNGSGSNCINFSNTFAYDLFTFQVNVSGSYTFSLSGSTPFGTMINLYENAFSPSSPCTNFVTSNGVFASSSVSIGNSITANLNTGTTYVIAVGSFDGTTPALPANYSATVSGPVGGNIYSGTPNPGGSFSYKYVIVNNATGNISAITSTPDLTAYAFGSYTVYGLSVNNSVTQTVLNTYVGGTFVAFQTALINSVVCASLSANSIVVTVTNPLHLSSLRLSAVASNSVVKLIWTAVGEDETENYLVERSADGRTFSAIGNKAALRTGSYQWVDEQPAEGSNLYRIRAVSKGNQIYFSNVAVVNFHAFAMGTALIIPNPAAGQTTVRLPIEGLYDCRLTDLSGKTLEHFTVNGSQFSLDLSDVATGVYLLHCRSKDQNIISRIVRQ